MNALQQQHRHHGYKGANKTDAGNGSKAICRVSNVMRSPSPDPRRSPNSTRQPMSFRRNTSKALKWQQWLHTHQDELLACGIPLAVLQDESNWLYFLDHGYFTPVRGRTPVIQLEDMSRADAVRLCSFLAQSDYYPECSTLRWLRGHLQTPTSPRP